MRRPPLILAIVVLTFVWLGTISAQPNDPKYAEKIREYTTHPRFLNELVDHLPASDEIPSPLDHFGQIIGAPGVLHYVDEIHEYLRLLDNASPRVKLWNIGTSEEGRDMIAVAIADEAIIANLETHRTALARLSDPRLLSEGEAQELVRQAIPIYYATGGMHSPETGSPEMLMELAYRLAVGDTPFIDAIRKNVIFMFTPVLEVDGRDRMVDIYNYRKAHNDMAPSLVYWGHYVAHDNNRDAMSLSLNLTKNMMKTFLHWKPTVFHDLHESIPYLYVSTGTGPYNEYLDPVVVDEWYKIAFEEVTQLTKRGMPGVWTHGFYTGWAPNYLFYVGNSHNAIGRFYETFGNSIADTKERKLKENSTSRKWYRVNPPLENIDWSLRNNANYMQSGLLVALKYVADNPDEFLENFYLKNKRAIERGRTEAPYAWVIPEDQERPVAAVNLVNLLRQQGVEVHRAGQDLQWEVREFGTDEKEKSKEKKTKSPKTKQAAKGSYVVRMDQPYNVIVRMMLDIQRYPTDASPPYDDTGWTFPLLRNVTAERVDDPSILQAPMALVKDEVTYSGRLEKRGQPVYLVNHNTEDGFALLRLRLPDVSFHATEESFKTGKHRYAAGSWIIKTEGNPSDLGARLQELARELGLTIRGASKVPDVPTHSVEVPRVALVHTWVSTPQNAGWWRLAFDNIGIPYTYIAEQDLAVEDLSKFDVIIMPYTWANTKRLINGTTEVGRPLPWKQTDEYKHIGIIDETEDTRRGMGYDGLENFHRFIKRGGVFITEGPTCSFPIDVGIVRRIRIKSTNTLQARGTVLKAVVKDKKSPITYGYDDTLAVYFNQRPVMEVTKRIGNFATPDWYKDEVWAKEMPRVVLSFAKKNLLMSGMLKGAGELAGAPAVVDVPVGEGHVVLFANRSFWRWETHGSHALVFNTMLHWNDLMVGWPERPEEEEEEPAAVLKEGWWEID